MGKAPLFVRPPTEAERQAVEDGLRSPDAFVLRRAQIILASAQGEQAGVIAPRVGFSGQAVRAVIRAFTAQGVAAVRQRARRNRIISRSVATVGAEAWRALLLRSPRDFAKPTGVWTLDLAAAVAPEQGLTAWRVSGDTMRATLARRGVRWRRAKEWITSPDPQDARKKARRDRLIRLAQRHPDGLLGCADEVWGSRLAPPALDAWQDDAHPLRLVAQTVARDDPDPTALACSALLARCWDAASRRRADLWLRCVEGRPVSAVTVDFLCWCTARAQERGTRAVLLVWDNASWHESQLVRTWLRQHNRQVKQSGHGVRLVVCYLPPKSPWLNPSEPKGLAGKKRVAEPARLLSAQELEDRICAAFGCARQPHLIQPHTYAHKSKEAA
jgi:transposase